MIPNVMREQPVTGSKTVTTIAAELFAGASRLKNRYAMKVDNVGASTIYLGGDDVTTATGSALVSGDSLIFTIDKFSDVPIYAIGTGSDEVRIMEVK